MANIIPALGMMVAAAVASRRQQDDEDKRRSREKKEYERKRRERDEKHVSVLREKETFGDRITRRKMKEFTDKARVEWQKNRGWFSGFDDRTVSPFSIRLAQLLEIDEDFESAGFVQAMLNQCLEEFSERRKVERRLPPSAAEVK